VGGAMRAFVTLFKNVSGSMRALAAITLFLMMMLTVVDVVLRSFGKPLIGTYELVAVAGAIVVGFAVAQTSWDRGHIFVDFLVEKRSPPVKNAIFAITRLFGIVIFALLSYNLLLKANHLYRSGEVSMTLHIPYYPAAYALAFCFFIEVFVLIADIVKIFVGEQK
jgi:TRAP-type C4-dicarboxylate transport system permease small subunit